MNNKEQKFRVAETFDNLMTPEPDSVPINTVKSIQMVEHLGMSSYDGRGGRGGNGIITSHPSNRSQRDKKMITNNETEKFNNMDNKSDNNINDAIKKSIFGSLLFFVLSHDKSIDMVKKINSNELVSIIIRLIIFFILCFLVNKYL